MADYRNIILLSDMDGTLLNSKGEVSEKNRQAIKDFIAQGGRFGIATGRSQLNALTFLGDIEMNSPCILFNGCALFDYTANKYLELYQLPKEILIDFLRYCLKEFLYIVIQIHCTDMCYTISPEEYADEETISTHQPGKFSKLEDILDKPWIKILFSGKPEDLKAAENKIYDFGISSDLEWVYTQIQYLEFLPLNVSKGCMIRKLKEVVGEVCTIYAVGDYNNDLEMIKEADIGIATSNAIPELKEIADVVTVSNDEDAIAEIIYHLMEK